MTSAVLANLDGKINSIAADTAASKLNQQEHEIILLVLDINVISDTKFYLFKFIVVWLSSYRVPTKSSRKWEI